MSDYIPDYAGEIPPGTGPLKPKQAESEVRNEEYRYSVSSEASLLHPDENQDYLQADPETGIFLVADGMGATGNEGEANPGSVARSVSNDILATFRRDLPKSFLEFKQRAENAWKQAKALQSEIESAGDTTLSLVQVVKTDQGPEAWIAWSGDSPVIEFTTEKTFFGTKTKARVLTSADNIVSARFDSEQDQEIVSFVNSFLDNVETDEEMQKADSKFTQLLAKVDPKRLAVIKQKMVTHDDHLEDPDIYYFWYRRNGTYGFADTNKPHILNVPLSPNSKLAVMSDGVSDLLSLNQMAKIASQNPEVKTLASVLVNTALELGQEKMEIDEAMSQAEKEGRDYNGPNSPLRVNKIDDATCIAVEVTP